MRFPDSGLKKAGNALPTINPDLKDLAMIQRIQTVYLVLAAACGFGALALPLATTGKAIESSELFSDAAFTVQDNPGLLALFAIAGVLAVVAVFLYKNRPVQMKVTRFALIADIVGLVLTVILFWRDLNNVGAEEIGDGTGAYLPLAFILFAILALRGIRKDENLVRSADRLR